MKYTEFPYKRIDIENSKSDIADIVSSLSKSNSSTEQIKSIMEMDTIMREYSSYEAIASLNFSRNINDASAKSEKEYYDSIFTNESKKDINYNKEVLSIFSRQVLQLIKDCKNGEWEHMVPEGVSDIIKEKNLFYLLKIK